MYCLVCGENDHIAQVCHHGAIAPEFGDTTQVVGTIQDRPGLPPECHNGEPVDVDRAWLELQRSCRGG
jgi:hypothetical protein